MDDFIISYYDLVDNEELDDALVNNIKQEGYLYSMREKMNELLNDKNIKL